MQRGPHEPCSQTKSKAALHWGPHGGVDPNEAEGCHSAGATVSVEVDKAESRSLVVAVAFSGRQDSAGVLRLLWIITLHLIPVVMTVAQ